MNGRTWNLEIGLRATGTVAERSVVRLQGAWRIARSRLIKEDERGRSSMAERQLPKQSPALSTMHHGSP